MLEYLVGGKPYCGAPVSPAEIWSRWNLDPVLIGTGLVLAVIYFASARRFNSTHLPVGSRRQAAFGIGWVITVAALISPLCPLSVSLFAGRVGQHAVLLLIAAPLIAAGHPISALCGLFAPRRRLRQPGSTHLLLAAATFAALLWFWHAPAPYAATFSSTLIYWSMHVTLFGAAVWLWYGLLDTRPAGVVTVLGASIVSTVQMGFLGALITLAPRPLYAPHLLTTTAWNLTPLQDQQLGGAIMWVPGCVVFVAVAMLVLWQAMQRGDWAQSRPVGLT